jgi:secreted trypsin-like serine protease
MPEILQKVDLKVVNQEECKAKYASVNKVTENMICAGDDPANKAGCNGDSGGPLQCQNEAGVWQLVGVTSWSLKCGQDGDPTVYTRVSRYEEWIHQVMKTNRRNKRKKSSRFSNN